jgi:hypothetical protein
MKIIFHKEPDPACIEKRRLAEDFSLSPEKRVKKMFELMKMSLRFKSNDLKNKTPKGILLIIK